MKRLFATFSFLFVCLFFCFSSAVAQDFDYSDFSTTVGSSVSKYSSYEADPNFCGVNISSESSPGWLDVYTTTYGIRFEGTPNSVGSYDVSINYNAGRTDRNGNCSYNSVSNSFTITVVNSAPSISSIPDYSRDEGSSFNYNVSASDPDGDNLSYSLTSAPSFLSISGNRISGTPGYNDSGSYTVSVRVSDGSASDTESFTLTVNHVNQSPSINSNGIKSASEGNNYSYNVRASDPDGDNISYSMTQGPSWLSFSGSTLTGTPGAGDTGNHSIGIRVSDGNGGTDTQSYTLTVSSESTPPIINSNPVSAGEEGSTYSYEIYASDADNDQIYFNVEDYPGWANFTDHGDGTATLEGTPGYEDSGSYPVSFWVGDESGVHSYFPLDDNSNASAAIDEGPYGNDGSLGSGSYMPNYTPSPFGTGLALDFDGGSGNYPYLDFSAPFTVNPGDRKTVSVKFNFNRIYNTSGDIHALGLFMGMGTGSWDGYIDYRQTSSTHRIQLEDDTGQAYYINIPDPLQPGTNYMLTLSFDENGVHLYLNGEFIGSDDPLANTLTIDRFGAGYGGQHYNGTVDELRFYNNKLPDWFIQDLYEGALTSVVPGDSQNFTIDISHTNRSPSIDSSPNKNASEDNGYSYNIEASDPDGDGISYSYVDGPGWLSLSGSTLSGTPSLDDAGSYSIQVRVSDGNGGTDTQSYTLSVSNTNQGPTISSISNKSVNEASSFSQTIQASDPDGDNLTYSKVSGPGWLSMSGNTLSGTPGYNHSGSYTIEVEASDGSYSDSESFTLTVNHVNRSPSIDSTPNKSASEGNGYSYDMQASDPDGDNLTYSKVSGPGWLSMSGNTLSGTPGYNHSGSHSVEVRVSDGNGASDTQSYTLSVSNTNRSPSVSSISNKSVNEASSFSQLIEASDPDGNSIDIIAVTKPGFLSFSDNNDGTAELSGTPGYEDSGTYTIEVEASDGSYSDSESFTLTVNHVNRSPSIDSNPSTSVSENSDYNYYIEASDPDGDGISYTYVDGPGWLSLSDNRLYGRPGHSDSGSYSLEVRVSDGNGGTDTQSYTLSVSNTNRSPSISSISNKSVDEGGSFNYDVSASDPDGQSLDYSLTSGPSFLSISGNTISGNPGYNHSGDYTVTVEASDGSASDTESFTLTVNEVNRTPSIDSSPNKSASEASEYSYDVSASDPDGDGISYVKSIGPSWLSMSGNTLSGTPGYNASGSYGVEVKISDGRGGTDTQSFTLSVSNTNRSPSISSISNKSVDEASSFSQLIEASDPDGNNLDITAVSKPGFLSFSDNNDGTAELSGTPGYSHSGTYTIEVEVTDGSASDTESFTLTVDHVNRTPSIDSSPSTSVNENEDYEYNIQASDPDGDDISYTYVDGPTWLTLSGSRLYGRPGYSESGDHSVEIRISDGEYTDTQTFSVSVNNVNRSPSVNSISNKSVDEGNEFNYDVSASDPDGQSLDYSLTSGPSFLSVSGNTILGTAGFSDSGEYTVTVEASDGSASDSESFTLTVNEVNRNPSIDSSPSTSVSEASEYSYDVGASDPDGDNISYSYVDGPGWLSMNGNTLSGTPGYEDKGDFRIDIRISDGRGGSDTQSYTLSVSNTNRSPSVSSISNKSVDEASSFSQLIEASDPDGETPPSGFTFTANSFPDWASFTDNGDGTATLEGTPGYEDSGDYNVSITVEDGGSPNLSDTETFLVTVNHVNRNPSINSTPSTSGKETNSYSYNISTSDPDRDQVTISAEGVPEFLSFTDNGDGTAVINGTPGWFDSGSYDIDLTVVDHGSPSLSDSQSYTLTVENSNRAPDISSQPITAGKEDDVYTYDVNASDPDGETLTYSMTNGPGWLSMSGNTLSGTPGFEDKGTHNIEIEVEDTNGGTDRQDWVLNIENTNRNPAITSSAVTNGKETNSYTYSISADDSDSEQSPSDLSFSASGLPSFLSFVDNGDGTAELSGTPGYEDSGDYNIAVSVEDGGSPNLSYEQTYTLSIANTNRPPTITSTPDMESQQQIEEGRPHSYTMEVSDPDTENPPSDFSFVVNSMPYWATLTNNGDGTATIEGTPGYGDNGVYQFDVTVSDSDSENPLTDQQYYAVAVEDINGYPAFTSEGIRTGKENDVYTYEVETHDPDALNNVTVSIVEAPNWLSLTNVDPENRSATLTGTPGFEDKGTHQVQLKATDSGNPTLYVHQSFDIEVSNTNRNPIITSTKIDTVTEGQDYIYSIEVNDLDSEQDPVDLSISADGVPDFLSFTDNGDGTATLEGTPGYTDNGNYPITLTVQDGGEPNLSSTQDIDLDVINDNSLPVFETTPVASIGESEVYNYSINLTDADEDSIVVTAPQFPSFLSFTDNGDGTATLEGTPDYSSSGEYNISIEATDGKGIVEHDYTLTVENTNRNPSFSTSEVTTGQEGETYSYDIVATDPDGENITFSLVEGPEWLSVINSNPNNGSSTLEGTPSLNDAGSYDIELIATDSRDSTAIQSYILEIGNTNQTPAIVSTADTTAKENEPYSHTLQASDPDPQDPLSFNGVTIPDWASLTDHGDGTATLEGTPSFEDMGTDSVKVSVSDTAFTALKAFAIDIAGTNRQPTITSTEDLDVGEKEQYTYDIITHDPDGDDLIISTEPLPEFLSFTDHGDGTAVIQGTPNIDQAGSYPISITVEDTALSDNQSYILVVGNTNVDLAFTSIPDTTVAEDSLYNYQIEADDHDGDDVTFSIIEGPSWLSIQDEDPTNRIASLTGTPGYEDKGTYRIEIEGTDSGNPPLSNEQSFYLEVGNTNREPVFTSSKVESATEGEAYAYHIEVDDFDSEQDPADLSISADGVPEFLSFTDHGDGTATLEGTPGYTDNGSYPITLTVQDGGEPNLSSIQSLDIEVSDVNDSPVFTSTADTVATEFSNYSYTISTSDADGDSVTLSNGGGLPGFLSFTDNGDGTATLEGTPQISDSGIYNIIIKAVDGVNESTHNFSLKVYNKNRKPVFLSSGITEGKEGETYIYKVESDDPDVENTTISIVEAPEWLSLNNVSPSTGTATLEGTPSLDDAGTHSVELLTTDTQDNSISQSFDIVVANTNQAPSIVSTADTTAKENEPYSHTLQTSDPDPQDPLSFNGVTIPNWATLTDHGDGTATLEGTPGYEDEGQHEVNITVSDTAFTGSQSFIIEVSGTNRAPSIVSERVLEVEEVKPYLYEIQASDPDGDSLGLSVGELPEWLSFTDNGDNTATLEGTPGYEDAGDYPIEITVEDTSLSSRQAFDIIVSNTNRAFSFTSTPDSSVAEDGFYSYEITTSESDGENISFSITEGPEFLEIVNEDPETGTAELRGLPGFKDEGIYRVELEGTDSGNPPLSKYQSFYLYVDNTNRLPEFISNEVRYVREAENYRYVIEAVDPDGEELFYNAEEIPSWLTLSDNGDGTATLEGRPNYQDNGSYPVTISIFDGYDSITQSFTINVEDVNSSPVFVSNEITAIAENQLYSYTLETKDNDADSLTISAVEIPEWATLTDNGDGTATLEGTPSFDHEGEYRVEVKVADNQTSESQAFQLSVDNTNRAPSIDSDKVLEVEEAKPYLYEIQASDPDGDSLALSVGELPEWLSFTDNGDNTATLEGEPGYEDAGDYPIEITVEDGGEPNLSDSQAFDLVVSNTNVNFEFTSTPDSVAFEDSTYSYNITAVDPDGNDVSITLDEGPEFLNIINKNPESSTATLEGTPGFEDKGSYEVVLKGTDSGNPPLTFYQTFTITVGNTNRAPEITSTEVKSGPEGKSYLYEIQASDPDRQELALSVGELPEWLSFTDNGDNTAILEGKPGFQDHGDYPIEITVEDGGEPNLSSLQSFTLDITDVNSEPTFTSSPVDSVRETDNYTYSISTDDLDGDSLSIKSGSLPTWLALADHGDGTATLEGQPGYSDAGSHEITVTVSDSLSDTRQAFTINVANSNRVPAFTTSPIDNAIEGEDYSYSIKAADPDENDVTISIEEAPEFLSIANVEPTTLTATLEGTPSLDDAGTYPVTLVATDSNDSTAIQSFDVVVSNTNQGPTIISTADTSGKENVDYSYTLETEDPDNDEISFTAENIPEFLSFTDHGDGTATLEGVPGFETEGTHSVHLSATDGEYTYDQEFALAVAGTNRTPSFTSDPVLEVEEVKPYNYIITTADPDGDSLSISADGVPSFLSFSDNGDNTATLQGRPGYEDAGDYPIEITVEDTSLSTRQAFDLVVSNTNRAFSFTSTPDSSVTEDGFYSYEITTSESDGENISFSITEGPEFLEIVDEDPETGTAELRGLPGFKDEGIYRVELEGTDSGNPPLSKYQSFYLYVANTNRVPEFISSGVQDVKEAEQYRYVIEASDPDGEQVMFDTEELPSWLSLTDNGDNTATLEGRPNYQDNGSYPVTISIFDGYDSVTQSFTINVEDVNSSPVFVSNEVTSTAENQLYSYTLEASDADADDLSISAVEIPEWATLTDNGDGTATLEGTPSFDHDGEYRVEVKVADTQTSESQAFQLTVDNTNRAPSIVSDKVLEVEEAKPYLYEIQASDPDGDSLALSVGELPEWLSFTDNGDNTATLEGEPGYENAGDYPIEITVEDGGEPNLSDSQAFDLVVSNTNVGIVFTSNPTKKVSEADSLFYSISADDSDGDNVTLSLKEGPDFVTVTNVNPDNGTASFQARPSLDDAGEYRIEIEGVDSGNPPITKSQVFTLTVENTNQAPSISSKPITSGKETESYTYNIKATDPDPDNLSFSVLDKPSFLSFTDHEDNTATLEGTPVYKEGGNYEMSIEVSDGEYTDTQTFTISFENTNREPVIQSEPVTYVQAETYYEYQIIATDSTDGISDEVTFSATRNDGSPLPSFLSLKDMSVEGEGYGTALAGTPQPADIGSYDILIKASDGRSSVSQSFNIDVTNENKSPTITSKPDSIVIADSSYSYSITSIEPDGDSLTYELTEGPSFLSLVDNEDGTAILEGTPSLDDKGTHLVRLRVIDNGRPKKDDIQAFDLEVQETNYLPEFATAPPKGESNSEGVVIVSAPAEVSYKYDIVVADTLDGIPGNINISAHRNGNRPLPEWLTLRKISDIDELENVLSKVSGSKGSSKNKDSNSSQSTSTNSTDNRQSLIDNIEAGKVVVMRLEGTPPPQFEGNEYDIVIRAEDGRGLVSEQSFYLYVSQANQKPEFTSTPDALVRMDDKYNYEVIAKDPDGDSLEYKVSITDGRDIPSWLSVDRNDSTIVISGIPEEDDIGTYPFEIVATDDGDPAKSRTQSFQLEVKYKEVSKLNVLYNYPNPFRAKTRVKFELPASDEVYLELFNTNGSLVRRTNPQSFDAGANEFTLEARNLAAGIYIYRIISSDAAVSGRLTLIR